MASVSLLKVFFSYPLSDYLLNDVSVVFDRARQTALVGDNGCGKTTLLRLIAGDLEPNGGNIIRNASIRMVTQINDIDRKSGGERQILALRDALASDADILLLDEPTNNLDKDTRTEFFKMLKTWDRGMIIVSHDRELLNQMNLIIEISNGKIRTFGGNYDFYRSIKDSEQVKLALELANVEKRIAQLNKTKQVARSTMRSHEAKQTKDKANHKRSRLAANALNGKSSETAGKTMQKINQRLEEQFKGQQKISQLMIDNTIKIPIPSKPFTKNNLLIIDNLSFGYNMDIFHNFSILIRGRERIRIAGNNGSGKTTLINLIMGQIQPDAGIIKSFGLIHYLDQDLSLLQRDRTILDNIMNMTGALKNDAHAIAANVGFKGNMVLKKVSMLSGGELLKATLASIIGGEKQPDMLIMDEPTNNLDIKSINVLESALMQYQGAIIIISHDEQFIKNINIERIINL